MGLLCWFSILGIIGPPTSGESLTENLRESIRLGLDLRGGTHLVLQVRGNDAVNAEIDLTIERLRATLDREQIDYGGITPVNAGEIQDPGGILVQGVPLEQTAAFRAYRIGFIGSVTVHFRRSSRNSDAGATLVTSR